MAVGDMLLGFILFTLFVGITFYIRRRNKMGTQYEADPIGSGVAQQTRLNEQFEAIEEALERSLSRFGDGDNTMQAPLDMDGEPILNLPEPSLPTHPVRLADLGDFLETAKNAADAAADSASAASSSASAASSSASAAEESAIDANAFANTAQSHRDNAQIFANAASDSAIIASAAATSANASAISSAASANAAENIAADVAVLAGGQVNRGYLHIVGADGFEQGFLGGQWSFDPSMTAISVEAAEGGEAGDYVLEMRHPPIPTDATLRTLHWDLPCLPGDYMLEFYLRDIEGQVSNTGDNVSFSVLAYDEDNQAVDVLVGGVPSSLLMVVSGSQGAEWSLQQSPRFSVTAGAVRIRVRILLQASSGSAGDGWQVNNIRVLNDGSGAILAPLTRRANLADLDDPKEAVTNLGLRPSWIRAAPIGDPLDLTGISQPRLCSLNEEVVALYDPSIDELTAFRFDGEDWSQVGNSLTITLASKAGLTALNETDVVMSSFSWLRVYRFDGEDWTQVGNELSGTFSDITAMNGTDIAAFHVAPDELRVYRFDGEDWTQVGNALPVGTSTAESLTTFNETDIVYVDTQNRVLRVYRFDGTNWAQVGNDSGNIFSAGVARDIAALNGTDIAYVNENPALLVIYRFDGANWSQVGDSFALGGGVDSDPTVTALNGTDVAVAAGTFDTLRAFRFAFYLGEGPYRP